MARQRTTIMLSLLGSALLVPLACSAVNSWHNRGVMDAAAVANEQELAKLRDTELWRSWFVYEMQRHDVHMGLSPLPWPGKLVDLPSSVTEPTTQP